MTISSPKAAVLWYEFEALSPAAHTEVYQYRSKNKFRHKDNTQQQNAKVRKQNKKNPVQKNVMKPQNGDLGIINRGSTKWVFKHTESEADPEEEEEELGFKC